MSQYTRQFTHSRRSRALQWAVALAIGTTACGAAQALRVGHSRVVSAPGAPLQALVALQDLTPEELASLKVSLADEAAWQRAGLRPPVPLASMVVKLEDGPNATYKYARIRSADSLSAPVVDLLLNVSSSSGQRQVQVSIVVPLRGSGVDVAPAAVGTSTSRGRTAGSVAVKYGDTMYAIAQRNPVAGADVNQMLVALWRANPKAFIESNMNMVRAGKTLALPDAATVRAINPAEARRIVAEHNAAYARYRARAAAAVTASPAVVRAQEGTSGAVTTAPGDSSTSTAAPAQDRLRISNAAAQDSAAAKADAQADAKTSTARALADAEGRVNELQGNVNALNQAVGKSATAADSSAGPGGTSTSKQTAATPGTSGAPAPAAGAGAGNAATSSAAQGTDANAGAGQAASSSAATPPTGATAPANTATGAAAGTNSPAASGSAPVGAAGTATTTTTAAAGSAASPSSSAAPATTNSSPGTSASSATSALTPPVAGVAKTGSSTPEMAKVDPKTGQPSTDDFNSSLPPWLADNLLVIVTAILALIAFAIAWMLRRAGTRRDDDDEETYAFNEPELNTAALNNRLNNINLDLDEPPTDEPRHVDGPRT